MLFAIDPGLREAGIAVFQDGELFDAFALYAERGEMPEEIRDYISDYEIRPGDRRIIIEGMSARKNMQAAWGDLFQIHLETGITIGMLGSDWKVIPANEWTGGRPKKVNHPLIRSILSPEELRVLDWNLKDTPKANHKEILDAVGVGLYELNRL